MTIGDRIREIRMQAGEDGEKLTLEKFGQRVSLTNQAISAMESGRSKPSNATIDLICREFNISREWLETGEGEMHPLPTSEFDDLLAQLVEYANQQGNEASVESIGFVLRWYMKMTDSEREFLDAVIHAAVEATKKDPA